MKHTPSILVVAMGLVAACAPSDSDSNSSETEVGPVGTDGDASSTNASETADATGGDTDDETAADGSSGGSGGDCALPSVEILRECPEGLPALGLPDERSVDTFAFDWETFDEACETSLAAPQYFLIPDDIISLSLVVEAAAESVVLVGAVSDGTVLIDAQATGETSLGQPPLKHLPGSTANLTLPLSPDTLPTPGCLAILPAVPGDVSGGGLVHVATRRGDPLAATGEFSINAIRVGDVAITQEQLEAALLRADTVYGLNGAGSLASVDYTDISTDDGTFIPTTGAQIEGLRSANVGGPTTAINVFFIDDFTDATGVLGIAAGIPGPNGVPETRGSGVVIALESHRTAEGTLDTTLMGETIAHELGHQLGLFHTTESDGTDHDVVPDTAECTLDMDIDGDGQLTAEECPDGDNVMFWTSAAFPQDLMSPAQADVIFYSPVSE